MKGLKNFFRTLWKDESGQSSVEYILILGVLVAVVVVFGKTFRSKITELVDKLMGKVQSEALSAGDSK